MVLQANLTSDRQSACAINATRLRGSAQETGIFGVGSIRNWRRITEMLSFKHGKASETSTRYCAAREVHGRDGDGRTHQGWTVTIGRRGSQSRECASEVALPSEAQRHREEGRNCSLGAKTPLGTSNRGDPRPFGLTVRRATSKFTLTARGLPRTKGEMLMTIKIKKTANATVVTATGTVPKSQRVEIVPGSIHQGHVKIGTESTISGVVLTVRPV